MKILSFNPDFAIQFIDKYFQQNNMIYDNRKNNKKEEKKKNSLTFKAKQREILERRR